MPIFSLITNIKSSQIPTDFLLEASKLIASSLGKPESYVTIHVQGDVNMIHGGTSEPCGSAQLHSIGKLGVEENKTLSNIIGEFLEAKLGIKPDRCYIKFVDIPRAELGYNKTTFDTILGKK